MRLHAQGHRETADGRSIERELRRPVADCAEPGDPEADLLSDPILQPGSWIGGDRDGNPNVTAAVVRRATASAAYTALAHHLSELTDLEQELSMFARLVAVSPELTALEQSCPDAAPGRRAVPAGPCG